MQERNSSGQFQGKSESLRRVRSLRVTDEAWEKMGEVAEDEGMTRADWLERTIRRVMLDPAESLDLDEALDIISMVEDELIEDADFNKGHRYSGKIRAVLTKVREALKSG